MRHGYACVVLLLGCNVIFEENPTFMEETDSTTMAQASTADSGMQAGPGTTATTETAATTGSTAATDTSLECGTDIYEPNDNDVSGEIAILPDASSSDPPRSLDAHIDTSADEDWFKINVDHVGGAIPTPAASVTAAEAMRVCAYVGCSEGAPSVDCGAASPSTAGISPGCCDTDAVSLTYDCPDAAELDGFMMLRLSTIEPVQQCMPYALTFGWSA